MTERLFDPQKDSIADKTIEQLMKENSRPELASSSDFLSNYYSSDQHVKQDSKRRPIGAPSMVDGQEKPRTVYWIVVAKSQEADKFFIGPYFCLSAGTKIMLGEDCDCGLLCGKNKKNEKNIEDIVVGDRLMTYNESTRTVEMDEVTEVSSMMADEIVTITFSDGVVIKATSNHSFYHLPKKWVQAGNLVTGDFIVSYSKVKLIDSVEREKKLEKVYDVSMKNNHNFFAEGVLVHNTKEGADNRVKNTSGGFVTMFKTIEQDPEKVKREYTEYEGQI